LVGGGRVGKPVEASLMPAFDVLADGGVAAFGVTSNLEAAPAGGVQADDLGSQADLGVDVGALLDAAESLVLVGR